jgi:diaminopimelate epimerase
MMRFTKMHGIGNDYIYVDCVHNPIPADPPALSRVLSDRHFGIGADGLILICPSEKADARMRMFNADGSESEMCGNGLRCVSRVRVNMGEPIFASEAIPTMLTGDPPVNAPLFVPGGQFEVTCLSMGNPHAVTYVPEQYFSKSRDLVAEIGPLIENHAAFPRRVNVHFVKVHSTNEVTMRTWERGSGITLSCGTGACSVCVSGVLTGRTGRELLAHLPGGDLELDWSESDNCVYMTGPATEVFTGEWPG